MSRRGLVLGAGGFLGAAWMLGALAAIQESTAWDARDADLMVGTSAGAVLTALLRAGVSVGELYQAHRGAAVAAVPDDPAPCPRIDLSGEPCWPGLPELRFGSIPLVVRAARSPLRVTPSALCAAMLPRGRRPLTRIGEIVDHASRSSRWPDGTWVVAMNYHTGTRVAFGRTGSPTAPIARAVMASCAVPAWYAPVQIGRIPYIDGAICSPPNADLLADAGLDEVYVLAPMASLLPDRPRTALAWLERLWRRAATNRLRRELQALRASGTRVTVLTPNAADLAVMGVNMMDPTRQGEVMNTAKNSVDAQLVSTTDLGEPLLPDAA